MIAVDPSGRVVARLDQSADAYGIWRSADGATRRRLRWTVSRGVRLRREAIGWWAELTAAGGEGMVVKPLEFIAKSGRGIQPGIKCRGPEYLRVIYGLEYDLPGNLERLRHRGTLALKRSLAAREFALGIEGLSRFVSREPVDRVHECVFGVLALRE